MARDEPHAYRIDHQRHYDRNTQFEWERHRTPRSLRFCRWGRFRHMPKIVDNDHLIYGCDLFPIVSILSASPSTSPM
jgi:hypothetical protein